MIEQSGILSYSACVPTNRIKTNLGVNYITTISLKSLPFILKT